MAAAAKPRCVSARASAASARSSPNATSRTSTGRSTRSRAGDKTAPDFRRMKPVSSHRARITDFATWRGLLVHRGDKPARPLTATTSAAGPAGDGLWFGAIDDLYALGAPGGEGGPWKDTAVTAGAPSDPYLMTNFGRKSVALSHDRDKPVRFTIEVDFLATGVMAPVRGR